MRRSGSLVVILGALITLHLGGCVTPLTPKPSTTLYVEPIITPQKAEVAGARVGVFSFETPFADPALNSHLAHQVQQLLLARRFARVIEVIPESFR